MSDSARKKQRVSPRVSADATDHSSTLYNDLHRLASIAPKPVTPFRRAASAGGTPRSATIRTPGTARTPRGGPATRPLPARRAAPTTPHAIRALRERANAARTPGHVRRRSGRVQRETPRDLLRNLSRVLARDTQPIQPTPATHPRNRHSVLDLSDIEDDGPAAPRLSMPLDDMYDDDDSFNEEPPRPSLLAPLPDYDYDNGTVQSVEFGRRARSEDPRLDRVFGRRISEQFADLHDLTINGDEYELDGNFINRRGTLGPGELLEQVDEEEGDTEAEIRALTGRRGRGSEGDLGVFGEVEGEEEEPTFRFTIPPRLQVSADDEDDEEGQRGMDETMFEDGDGEVDEETQRRLDETIFEDGVDDQPPLDLAYASDTAPVLASDTETGPLEIAGWESGPDISDDEDLQAYRGEVSAIDRSLQTPAPENPAKKRAGRQRRALNISRFGHEYPSFPAATVKMLANGFVKGQGSKSKISKDTLAALVQTSDLFFEQVGEDLAAYAQHAGRKMIEEGDVIALLKRTRQVTDSSTCFSLAQKMLPRELLQQLRMEPPLPKLRRPKRKRMEVVPEEDGDE